MAFSKKVLFSLNPKLVCPKMKLVRSQVHACQSFVKRESERKLQRENFPINLQTHPNIANRVVGFFSSNVRVATLLTIRFRPTIDAKSKTSSPPFKPNAVSSLYGRTEILSSNQRLYSFDDDANP